MYNEIVEEIHYHLNSNDVEDEINFLLRKRILDTISILERNLHRNDLDPKILNEAKNLKHRVEKINRSVIHKYSDLIFNQNFSKSEIRKLLNPFTQYQKESSNHIHAYEEELDLLMNGIFGLDADKVRIPEQRDGFVHLETSPVSVILNMIDQLNLTGKETLIDLGSGLGLALFIFRLLTDVVSVGIEVQEPYYKLSLKVQERFKFSKLHFIHSDVRDAELTNGDIFYMFTPFIDKLMEDVLNKLRYVGETKHIVVCSYGISTISLGDEPWLAIKDANMLYPEKAAIFESKA